MVDYKIVELNNKSRKGIYIYVKEKGKSGSYYKYDQTLPVENYGEYYTKRKKLKDKSFVQFKARKKLNMSFDQYKKSFLKKAKTNQRISLNTAFMKGRSQAEVKNLYKISNSEINKKYQELIEPLVKKKDIVRQIAKETNISKLKTGFEYKIALYDKDGEQLAIISHIGQKTLRQVIKEIQKVVNQGIEVKDFSKDLAQKVTKLGYQYKHIENGSVNTAKIDVKFRR